MKFIKSFEDLNEHIDYIVKEELTQDDVDEIEDAFIMDVADEYGMREISESDFAIADNSYNGGPYAHVKSKGYMKRLERKVLKIYIVRDNKDKLRLFNQSMKKLKSRLYSLGYESIGHPYIANYNESNFTKRYELLVYKRMFSVKKREIVNVGNTKPLDKRDMKYNRESSVYEKRAIYKINEKPKPRVIPKEPMSQDDIEDIEDAFILDIADKYGIDKVVNDNGYAFGGVIGSFTISHVTGQSGNGFNEKVIIVVNKKKNWMVQFNKDMTQFKSRLRKMGFLSTGSPVKNGDNNYYPLEIYKPVYNRFRKW